MFIEQIKELMEKHGAEDTGFVVYWSGGGCWRDCWGDETHVEEDHEPEYESLAAFMEDYDPSYDVSILQQLTELSYADYNDEYDYYGGSVKRCFKTISLDGVVSVLKGNGYGVI